MDTAPVETKRAARRHDLDLLRDHLVALPEACPRTRADEAECPLHQLRKLKSEQIMEWLDGCNRRQIEFLVKYHKCSLVAWWEGYGPKGSALEPAIKELLARARAEQ
jgi:hypothetical protein